MKKLTYKPKRRVRVVYTGSKSVAEITAALVVDSRVRVVISK